MVYVYANLWRYILLITNEMILLGSQVQKDKYQVSEATLPTVLQTEIKSNPWLSSITFKIQINFQVHCIEYSKPSLLQKFPIIGVEEYLLEELVHCVEIDRSGAFWHSVMLISVIKKKLKEHLQN